MLLLMKILPALIFSFWVEKMNLDIEEYDVGEKYLLNSGPPNN